MKNLGYKNVAKSFLVKNINGIDINITRRDNMIETITGYSNNQIVSIPTDIINQVKADIESSL